MAETHADATDDLEDLANALRWEVQQLAADFSRTPEGRGIRRPSAQHAWIRQHLADEARRSAAIAVLRRRKVRSPCLGYFSMTWPTMSKDLRQRITERAVAMHDADPCVPALDLPIDQPRGDQQRDPPADAVSGVAILLPPLAALASALYLAIDVSGLGPAEIVTDAVPLLVVGVIGMVLAVLCVRR